MCRILSISCFLLLAICSFLPVSAQEKISHPTPPEAVRQDGVPRGELIQGTFRDSQIFPGTERDYWVYLPKQLAADKPAPLMVACKQPYFHLHLPPIGTESHADGMCTSAEGWLLSATECGIQICDQAGRVNLILPKPGQGRRVCYVRLHENTLYAATADAVWKRPVQLIAAKPYQPPVIPPKARL